MIVVSDTSALTSLLQIGLEGLKVIGLLGVLVQARRRGMIPSLRQTVSRLQHTAGFRISDALKVRILKETGEEEE